VNKNVLGSVGPDGVVICEGPLGVLQAYSMDYKTVSMSALTSGDQRGEKEDWEAGDIRMDLETGRLICLRMAHYTFSEFFDMSDMPHMPWYVEDVLEGTVYTRTDDKISNEVYNAMETLGWAAEDHPDVEISGD
jgi:hypothetical protein